MTLAEATRQYQVALEHRRKVEEFFDGTESAAEEIDWAYEDYQKAKSAVEVAWMNHIGTTDRP